VRQDSKSYQGILWYKFVTLMQLSIKYRPNTFSEVVGQHVPVTILKNSILMNRIPKALLLTGLHGCGKTTLARLYAKAVNCENFETDVCNTCSACVGGLYNEYDAASHNGVDDIRELEELIRYGTGVRYRVVILDECHMLSTAAQAALLKLMEDSDSRVIFILITTSPDKLNDTLVSRCLRLWVKPIVSADIVQNLSKILLEEGYTFDSSFLGSLVANSNGSLRDAQQLLNQVLVWADASHLSEDLLEYSFGFIPKRIYKDLAYCLNARNLKNFIETIRVWYEEGIDLKSFFEVGVSRILRDFAICAAGAYSDGLVYYSGIDAQVLAQNLSLDYATIKEFLRLWDQYVEHMKWTEHPRIMWESFATLICDE
jgi:DNA polymerase-3 subunit gamma/tau